MNLPTHLSRIRQLAPLALMLLSAIVAVAAYLQALNYPFFALDDAIYVTGNAKLAGLHLTELWRLFTEPYNSAFEFLPLRELSYWLDMSLFDLNPSAFRLHNIFLYLFCLPLVYATTLELWRYFRPADAASAPWAAAVVTSLFVLHPAHVEAVVWISGRKYVLPNLFSMLALWLAVRARREHGLSAPHAVAALFAFVAVMFSKASYVGLAPIIALLWMIFWLDIPASKRHRAQLLWPLAILFMAGLLTRIFIVNNKGYDSVPFYLGIEAVTRTLAVMGWLARLAVSPEDRHFFYPVFEDVYLPAMVALGTAVLAAAVASVILILRKRSLEGFALAAFLLLCMPYIQLIPNRPPSLVSDRYLALAVWPVILLIVVLLWRLKPAPRVVLLLAIALPWGYQTALRPYDWRSIETLNDSDFRAYPGHYFPVFQKIMAVQWPQGLYREASETAASVTNPDFRSVIVKLDRAYRMVHLNSEQVGERREAIALLWNLAVILNKPLSVQIKWNSPVNAIWSASQISLTSLWVYLAERFPFDAEVRYNTGWYMLGVRKYEEAVYDLRAAIESQRLPESVRGQAFRNLGLALFGAGKVAEAEAPLRAALDQVPPDLRAYCLLSKVYSQTKRLDEAARAEAECRKQAPSEVF